MTYYSENGIACIKAIEENLEDIRKVFDGKFYIRYSLPKTASAKGEFVIMDSTTKKGFVVKEGCLICFDKNKNTIFLIPSKNTEGVDIFEVQEV